MKHIKSSIPLQDGPERLSIPRWYVHLKRYLTSVEKDLVIDLLDMSTEQGLIDGEPWCLVLGGKPLALDSLLDCSVSQTKRALGRLRDYGIAASIGIRGYGTRLWVRGPKWRDSSKRAQGLSYVPQGSPMNLARVMYEPLQGSPATLALSRPRVPRVTSKTPREELAGIIKFTLAFHAQWTAAEQIGITRKAVGHISCNTGWTEWIDRLPKTANMDAALRATNDLLRKIATGKVINHKGQMGYCNKIYEEITKHRLPMLKLIKKTGTGEDEKN